MDYKCYCGATLEYSSKDKRWLCPMRHPVYPCKKCQESNKIIPLQWIEQYQRWYCYECKEYAPTAATHQAEEMHVRAQTRELTHTVEYRSHSDLGMTHIENGMLDQEITELTGLNMPFYPKCGKEVSPEANYCLSCGASFGG